MGKIKEQIGWLIMGVCCIGAGLYINYSDSHRVVDSVNKRVYVGDVIRNMGDRPSVEQGKQESKAQGASKDQNSVGRVGNGESHPISRGADRRELIVEATAYKLRGPVKMDDKIEAGPGKVAVDPAVIPLGSRLWVEGYGPAWAVDTGPAIQGHRMDVWFPSEKQCVEWGRHDVKVIVLEEGARSGKR